jgi:hypothetical protein
MIKIEVKVYLTDARDGSNTLVSTEYLSSKELEQLAISRYQSRHGIEFENRPNLNFHACLDTIEFNK